MQRIEKSARAARLHAEARRRQRGAALVEAALVLPVICSFLGMMIWFHSIYWTKQEVILRARADALTYASSACSGQKPPSDGSASGSLSGHASDAQSVGGVGDSLTTKSNAAHVTATGVAQGRGGTSGTWKREITYSASVMCNERSTPSGIAGMVSFAMDLVKSGNAL